MIHLKTRLDRYLDAVCLKINKFVIFVEINNYIVSGIIENLRQQNEVQMDGWMDAHSNKKGVKQEKTRKRVDYFRVIKGL